MSKGFPPAFEVEHRLRDMIRGDRILAPPEYSVPLTDVSLTDVQSNSGPGSRSAPPRHKQQPETPIPAPPPLDPSESTA